MLERIISLYKTKGLFSSSVKFLCIILYFFMMLLIDKAVTESKEGLYWIIGISNLLMYCAGFSGGESYAKNRYS